MAAGSGPDIAHSAIGNPPGHVWGCDATSTTTVLLFDGQQVFPCFTFSTLMDEMTAAGVSWKYYTPSRGDAAYQWNAADAFSQDWQSPNIVPVGQFVKDAAAGDLMAAFDFSQVWNPSLLLTARTCPVTANPPPADDGDFTS